jgi:membrane protease YdiL (CAAX protease family)
VGWVTLGLTALVSMVFVTAALSAGSGVLFNLFDSDRYWQLSACGLPAFVGALVLYLLSHRRTKHQRLLEGIDGPTVRRLATVGGAWLLIGIAMDAGGNGAVYIPRPTTAVGAVSFLLFGLVAEELLFRGVVFDLVDEQLSAPNPRNLTPAVWLSALLFGLSHLQYHGFDVTSAAVQQVVYTSALGLLLGWQRQRTGSLTLPVATHVLFNLPAAVTGLF